MTTTITPAMRRSILIATLRDKTLWPEGFKWDFSNCDHCAMGMLLSQTNQDHRIVYAPVTYQAKTGELLGLNTRQVKDIFSTPVNAATPELSEAYHITTWEAHRHKTWTDVTPAMVADRLEEMHRSLA